MLKEIDDQADTFGLKKFASVDFYFPRRVEDYDGLVAYLRNKNYKSKVENFVKKNEILELRGFLKKEGLLEETKTFLDDKNYTGLVTYLDNRSDWGVIDEAVKEAEDKAAKAEKERTDTRTELKNINRKIEKSTLGDLSILSDLKDKLDKDEEEKSDDKS